MSTKKVKRRRRERGRSDSASELSSSPNESTSGPPSPRAAPGPGATSSSCERRFYWTHYTECGFPNRVNHAVAACRGPDGERCVYSVGGYHADDDERTVIQADTVGGPFFRRAPIDIHCMDVDNRHWYPCPPPPAEKYFSPEPYSRTDIPGCRYGHTVFYYAGKLYMYGGRNDEDGSFSNVESYDTAKSIWLKILCVGEKPSSRDGHACTAIGDMMYIHGGFSARDIRFSEDLFSFSMVSHTWVKMPNKGDRFPERDFHTATAVNRKIVAFGGRSDAFAPYFTANDIYDNKFYCYDLDEEEWKVQATTGYEVIGRRSHTAARYGDCVIFFGGYNARLKRHFGDLFILDTNTWHITEIHPFGDAPLPRRRVGAVVVGNELIICGGTSPVQVERKGKQREILHDHNDMYILHLLPTLEQLCIMFLINEGVPTNLLPSFLQEKIRVLMNKPIQTETNIAPTESG